MPNRLVKWLRVIPTLCRLSLPRPESPPPGASRAPAPTSPQASSSLFAPPTCPAPHLDADDRGPGRVADVRSTPAVATRPRQYWAFAANPNINRIEEAVRSVTTNLWTTEGSL